jgi:hypothetical protein
MRTTPITTAADTLDQLNALDGPDVTVEVVR